MTCTISGCTKPVFASALCTTHYSRRRTHGDPNWTPPVRSHDLTGQRFGALVAIQKDGRRWLCRCDCGQQITATCSALNAGDHRHCGNRTLHRRVPAPTYRALHQRLDRDRGKASRHTCVDCGSPAQQWSYDYSDPNPLLDAKGSPYSTNLDCYSPRCAPCHGRHDYGRPGDRRNNLDAAR